MGFIRTFSPPFPSTVMLIGTPGEAQIFCRINWKIEIFPFFSIKETTALKSQIRGTKMGIYNSFSLSDSITFPITRREK